MKKISAQVYNRINNDVYKTPGDIWWLPDTILHLLKTSINPWRVGYSKGIIKTLGINPQGKSALEVGSGGGILTEEICKMGFTTTGIDPAEESVFTATNHAKASWLNIKYEKS